MQVWKYLSLKLNNFPFVPVWLLCRFLIFLWVVMHTFFWKGKYYRVLNLTVTIHTSNLFTYWQEGIIFNSEYPLRIEKNITQSRCLTIEIMQTKAAWMKTYMPKEFVVFLNWKRLVLVRHPISSVHPTSVGALNR